MKNKHTVRICSGPACSQMFSRDLMQVAKKLAAKHEQLTVEWCSCTGLCSEGPNVYIDNDVFTHMRPDQLEEEISKMS